MKGDRLTTVSQVICDHSKHRAYKQRRFDILKGFEIIETRCINCHKILALEIKRFGEPHLLNAF